MIDWPDPSFPLYSRTSRHRHDQADSAMHAEIARLLADRPAVHARLEAKGMITPLDAAAELRTLAAIAQDLRDAHDAAAGVTWRAKIDLLRAEIAHRRTHWGDAVRKGILARDEAIARLAAIEAVHDQYWSWGWWLDGGQPAARALDALIRAAAAAAAA